MFVLILLLLISMAVNGILIWYVYKVLQNLRFGINNIDELQKLLNEYSSLLQPLANMENYYGDPAIDSAVANTKLVIEACKVFKKTIIEDYDEESQENQEAEEGLEASEGQKDPQVRKAEATIGPVRS